LKKNAICGKFYLILLQINFFIMKKGTKIALAVLGVITLGVGVYMYNEHRKKQSGDKQKNSRKWNFIRTDK
jgi:cbb3-type cytochrome oxidase subunit 3